MSEAGAKNRDEKLKAITLPTVDCNCLDKRTRKLMLYLVSKELKTLKSYPTAWIEGSKVSLEDLKTKIESCDFPVVKRTAKGEKAPRELSEFNLFIKNCATSKDKGGQGKSFKECVSLWRARGT